MLESKHKGCYEYKKLFLLLLHPNTYHNVDTFSIISDILLDNFVKNTV